MSLLALVQKASVAAQQSTLRRTLYGPRHPRWSYRQELAFDLVRAYFSPVNSQPVVTVARTGITGNLLPGRLASAFESEAITAAGVPVTVLRPRTPTRGPRLFYLHGGGYHIGSPRTHAEFVRRLMRICGASEAWIPDYRLAPEHVFPAALDDGFAALRAFVSARPGPYVMAGDSAGGGLTLACLFRARAAGLPLPAGAALFSPWVDLTCAGKSIQENAPYDYLLPYGLELWSGRYAGNTPRSHPEVSPLFGDFHGLPPLFFAVGGLELFRDEVLACAEKAHQAGVDVTLLKDELMLHAWVLFHDILVEGAVGSRRAGDWLAQRARSGPTASSGRPASHSAPAA